MADQEQVAVVDEVPAEVVADQTLPAVEAQPAEEKSAQPAETEEKKNHNQRRHERMLRERTEYKVRAEMLAAENERLRQGAGGAPAPTANASPTREMFADDAAYIAAKVDYEVAQRIPKAVEQVTQRQQQQASASTWAAREGELADQHDDYDEAVEIANDIVMPAQTIDAIRTSEYGPDLVYHFGKNPEEAQRIAAMPPLSAARMIGQIEARIAAQRTAKPAVKVSAAPAPVRPVGAGGASAGTPLDKIDNLAEYQARRREQLIPRKT